MGIGKMPDVSRVDMLEAVTEGVRRAVWQMITNATDMPCRDFYASIVAGVEKAHHRIVVDMPSAQ